MQAYYNRDNEEKLKLMSFFVDESIILSEYSLILPVPTTLC